MRVKSPPTSLIRLWARERSFNFVSFSRPSMIVMLLNERSGGMERRRRRRRRKSRERDAHKLTLNFEVLLL